MVALYLLVLFPKLSHSALTIVTHSLLDFCWSTHVRVSLRVAPVALVCAMLASDETEVYATPLP